MARTKRPPPTPFYLSSIGTGMAQMAVPSESNSQSPPKTKSLPHLCTNCNLNFPDSWPRVTILAHITKCRKANGTSSAPSQTLTKQEFDSSSDPSHVLRNVMSSSMAPESVTSSSRLTTPPESPPVIASSEEDPSATTPRLNGDYASNAIGSIEGNLEDIDEIEIDQIDDTSDRSVTTPSQPYVPVMPYIVGETEYYDYEQATEASLALAAIKPKSDEEVEEDLLPGSEEPQSTAAVKRYGFPKLTDLSVFEAYLDSPDSMDYNTLYHRTAEISEVLATYKNEFLSVTKEVKDFEKSMPSAKEREAAAKRAAEEKRDAELWRLHRLYYKDLKTLIDASGMKKGAPRRDLKVKAEQVLKAHPNENEDAADNLALLCFGKTLSEMIERRDGPTVVPKRVVGQPKAQENYIDIPLPKLTTADLAVYNQQKKPDYEDPHYYEQRKTADVYGVPLILKDGSIDLHDRNRKGKDVEPDNDNRRSARSKMKRGAYETEQSETPGESSEELPAKRKRTQTSVPMADGSPARARSYAETREGSPNLPSKTFPSGKRMGRPPGSKTKVKPPKSKSKLQQSHLPPTTEVDDDDESLAPEEGVESQPLPRELAPAEEAQLQQAAEELVNKTSVVQDENVVVKKGKHGGARVKGVSAKKESEKAIKSQARGKKQAILSEPEPESVSERAPLPPKSNKGARGKKPSNIVVLKFGEHNLPDVVPSTEHDDQSRFASASTSRPTTASSGITGTTLGSGRVTRQQTREQSRAAGEQSSATPGPNALTVKAVPAKIQIKGKRAEKDEDVVMGEGYDEIVEPTKKKNAKKQNGKAESTPAIATKATSVAGTAKSGRQQKRKRAPAKESIEVALPEEVDEAQDAADESTPPPPKRRKSKPTIVQLAVAEDTDSGESGAEAPPKKRAKSAKPAAKRAIKKGKTVKQEQATESEYVSGEAIDSAPEQAAPKVAKRAAPKTKAKGKGKAIEEAATAPTTAQPSDAEPMAETELSAAELKAKQKSAKLSAATKLRWASGAMAEPMAKRKATNQAKKAARLAAKSALPAPLTTPAALATSAQPAANTAAAADDAETVADAGDEAGDDSEEDEPEPQVAAPPARKPARPAKAAALSKATASKSTAAKKSAAPARSSIPAKSAPVNKSTRQQVPPSLAATTSAPATGAQVTSAESSATRTSGRKRKRTERAMGLDGAADEEEDDGVALLSFRSEYEQFQALSSPGTPAMPKRQRKSLYNLSAAMRSEDDDDSY